jgi:Tfp pilus assembly protein FimV
LKSENAELKAQVTDLQAQLDSLQKAIALLAGKSAGGFAMNTQPQEAK